MGVSHIRGKKKGILGKENSMCKGLEVGNACMAGGIGECLEMRLRRIDQV